MIGGLVYPRRLFVIQNDIDWLSPVATTACHENGLMIYGAMGAPENFGFLLVGGHSHGAFPSSQTTELDLDTHITHILVNGDTGDIDRCRLVVRRLR